MGLERDTRTKLLRAAGEVFAEVGYHAATVRMISARAGTNVALVNYHFRDKLGLYTEVLKQSFQASDFERVQQALNQSAPPEDILRAVIRARLAGLCDKKRPVWHVRILVHELGQPSPALSRVIDQVAQPIYARILQLIGTILDLPPEHEKTRLCTDSVLGQIIFYALAGPIQKRLWPQLRMTPQELDRIANHIADFSLAYLRGRARKTTR